MNIMQVAGAYKLPLIDYERHGDGLLVSMGAGLMMATMDAIPRLRWCMDVSGGRDVSGLESFLHWASRECPLFVFHGWFSISEPTNFIAAFQPFANKTIWRSNSAAPDGITRAECIRELAQFAAEFRSDNSQVQDSLSLGSAN